MKNETVENEEIVNVRKRYLDLMKKCLMDSIYERDEYLPVNPKGIVKRVVVDLISSRGLKVVSPKQMDQAMKEGGQIHPQSAHTMIGLRRLNNIQECIANVISNGVEGDLLEAGVWRGGATIFMKAVLEAYGVKNRRVWVADSFAGLPPPNPEKYPDDEGDIFHTFDHLAVSADEVRGNFEKYGLLDENICFLEGWFRETLPTAAIEKLAILRLDGDMYESTIDGLANLYPKLALGGFVIIDDYGISTPGCRNAVNDYRRQNGITEEMIQIDKDGIYWKKEARVTSCSDQVKITAS